MAFSNDTLMNTILGLGSFIRGDLAIDGLIRVCGDIKGSIRASGEVIITDSSRCDASIVARSAIIGGVVHGDVCVSEHLTILDGGVIVGDVFAATLETEGDVTIHGYVEIPGPKDKIEDVLLAFIKKRGVKILPFGFDAAPVEEVREILVAPEKTWQE